MKKHIVTLMIISISLCGIVGVLLMNNLQSAKGTFEKEVRIEMNGVTSETLEVEGLSLVPGSETEYTAKLRCQLEGTYDLSLVFVETEPSPLRSFVNVEIEHEGEILKTATLAELLSGSSVEFVCDLRAESYTDLIFRFKMPVDVGDEAKGATADFDIDMKIKIQP